MRGYITQRNTTFAEVARYFGFRVGLKYVWAVVTHRRCTFLDLIF